MRRHHSTNAVETYLPKVKMPLLRTQYAGRLRPAIVLVGQRRSPLCVRYATTDVDRSVEPAPKAEASDPPAAEAGDSSMIRQEGSSEAMASHQPNWHAPVDHATS